MFSGGSSSLPAKSDSGFVSEAKGNQGDTAASPETKAASPATSPTTPAKTSEKVASGKRSGNGSPPGTVGSSEQKKRRSSGVSARASSLIMQAKNTLFTQGGSRSGSDAGADPKTSNQTPLQKLGKQDQALAVPQGQQNNAAGESLPGPRSTFRVGVWEDRNKACRRTMEDTHAFLYNFLCTPAPALDGDSASLGRSKSIEESGGSQLTRSTSPAMAETDNGYFAIFDGHAGTFAADWCGKKLHLLLEEIIRKNPNSPIPELLDQTFTSVDAQLENLPLKNSGCTAAIALLRWEDRVPSSQSATGSQAIASAIAKATEEAMRSDRPIETFAETQESTHARLRGSAVRQRVLYTANVGDARIILCRAGKALRLSYDHKGSDENEGKRIANAGGLILNNRVNGVLAVTRALGDTYMKGLVTGHPYTTETVIQPDSDEFMIIACDGLWDVCSDQEAVDLIRNVQDPTAAAKLLVDHALTHHSTDNLSCMIVRFDKHGLLEHQTNRDSAIGVQGDMATIAGKLSEADKIVTATKQRIAESGTPALGISASNSGHGHGTGHAEAEHVAFRPTAIKGSVEEEPSLSETPIPRSQPER